MSGSIERSQLHRAPQDGIRQNQAKKLRIDFSISYGLDSDVNPVEKVNKK